MPNLLIKTTVVAFAVGLFACLAQADATPRFTSNGLTSQVLPVRYGGGYYRGYGGGYGRGYGGYYRGYGGGYGRGYGGYGGYGRGYGGGYGGYDHGCGRDYY